MKNHIPYRNFPGLSPRENDVLKLLMDGKSEKQAAAALNISRHTVHTYAKVLHSKFQVESRSELLAVAFNQILTSSAVDLPLPVPSVTSAEASESEMPPTLSATADSVRTTVAPSFRMAVLDKFPPFDPAWDAACQRAWLRAYQTLLISA